MHACTHTNTHTHMHTNTHRHTHTNIHAHAHTHMHMHTHTDTHMHTHTHTDIHTHARTHAHTHTHAHEHTHTQTHTHTHTHAQAHTRTQLTHLYSTGTFILMSKTEDTKYIPCRKKTAQCHWLRTRVKRTHTCTHACTHPSCVFSFKRYLQSKMSSIERISLYLRIRNCHNRYNVFVMQYLSVVS